MNQDVVVGALLAGRYRVERILGAGQLSLVVAAQDEVAGERVAVKLLRRHGARPDQLERFLREPRLASRLRSPHAAAVLGSGASYQHLYIVMELLDGRDLGNELSRRGPLPYREAVGHVVQALEAVAEAHALGIVHRDLKPENLFLAKGPDGRIGVKVVDFGVAKLLSAHTPSSALTSDGRLLGTPRYMSPEQLQTPSQVDPRSDVWSLGVTLYELIAGVGPFSGHNVPTLCMRILSDGHRSLTALRPGLPEGLSVVVDRCLAKEPAERFDGGLSLARALAPFGSVATWDHLPRIETLVAGTVTDDQHSGMLLKTDRPDAATEAADD